MARVTVYATPFCLYCVGAKAFLRRRGIAYDEVPGREDFGSGSVQCAARTTPLSRWATALSVLDDAFDESNRLGLRGAPNPDRLGVPVPGWHILRQTSHGMLSVPVRQDSSLDIEGVAARWHVPSPQHFPSSPRVYGRA